MRSDLSTPACESLKKSRWPVEGSGGVGFVGVVLVGGSFGNLGIRVRINISKRPDHAIQEQLLTIPFQQIQ